MISVRFYYPSRKLGRASLKFRCLRLLRYLNNKHVDAEFSTNIHPSDILVISSVYSNQLVSEISSLKKLTSTIVVFDMCDNYFEKSYDNKAFLDLIELCDYFIVSSPFLKRLLESHGVLSNKVHYIDDSYEISELHNLGDCKHLLKRLFFERVHTKVHDLVWFGRAKSFADDGGVRSLLLFKNEVKKLQDLYGYKLTVISDDYKEVDSALSQAIDFNFIEYFHGDINLLLARASICLLPIPQNNFSLAKSRNRLITALRNNLFVFTHSCPTYDLIESDFVIRKDWERNFSMIRNSKIKPNLRGFISKKYGYKEISKEWESFFIKIYKASN